MNKTANPAQLLYGPASFEIVVSGDHVNCAITQRPIPLTRLCYWSVVRQEAYATAALALLAEQRAQEQSS